MLALATACIPLRDPNAGGPDGGADVRVSATTPTPSIFEGAEAVLTAMVTGGVAPYSFRWDQNAGPAEVELAAPDLTVVSTGALAETGRYVFRVVVTDAAANHATGFVAVEVVPAVDATAAVLAVIGDPVQLSAEVADPIADATFLWEVTQGEATIDSPTRAVTTLTTSEAETVVVRLTTTIATGGSPAVTATRQFEVASVTDLDPRVSIETSEGEFTLELDGQAAPRHTANFLFYVDEGFYDGLLIHRVACTTNPDDDGCDPFVIQGGGYRRADGELEDVEGTRDRVASEADNGLSNGVLYSVALALRGSPDSGSTQFFVNLNEANARLDDQGFTVFAQVVEGRDVVDAIAQVETTANPVLPSETSLPIEDIIIERARRE